MSALLSPSGHIPLNDATLEAMPSAEREFWEDFLRRIDKHLKAGGTELTAELRATFDEAVNRHNGDEYCQINQLRGIFRIPRSQ